MLTYKIFIGNSNNVPVIESNSIHLIVSSPPYGLSDVPEAIIYDKSNEENIGNYSGQEFLDKLKPVFKENYRILKTGRKMVINIVDVVGTSKIDDKMELIQNSQKTIEMCKEIGFVLEDIVIWDKIESAAVRILGSWPLPGSIILCHRWEYVIIFRKPGEIDWSHVTNEEKEAGKMSNDFIAKHFDNVWRIKAETSKSYHPAPFPIDLAKEAITLFTYPNEIVYDCFGGTGTVIQAAKQLQRSASITEIGFTPKDDRNWLDHVKEETNWGSGDLASNEVLYRILTTQGEIIEQQDVVGLGKNQLFKETHNKESSLFSFGLEVETKHSKQEKVILPEGEYVWEKNKEWKKQKVL